MPVTHQITTATTTNIFLTNNQPATPAAVTHATRLTRTKLAVRLARQEFFSLLRSAPRW